MEDQPMEASAGAIQPRHSHRAWRYVPSVLMIKKNKKQTKITSNKHQQQLQPQNFHNTWRHAPSVLMIINNNKTTSPNKTTIHNSQQMQTRSSNHTWGYDLKLFEISYDVEMMLIVIDGRRINTFLERQMKL